MTDNPSLPAGQRIIRNLGVWRYLQFVLVAIIAGALIDWLSSLQTLTAWLLGAVIGAAYFVLEKFRGTI
jgi:membrane associated rhomboid family serine protease